MESLEYGVDSDFDDWIVDVLQSTFWEPQSLRGMILLESVRTFIRLYPDGQFPKSEHALVPFLHSFCAKSDFFQKRIRNVKFEEVDPLLRFVGEIESEVIGCAVEERTLWLPAWKQSIYCKFQDLHDLNYLQIVVAEQETRRLLLSSSFMKDQISVWSQRARCEVSPSVEGEFIRQCVWKVYE
jgi:hypothetical protein